MSATSATQKLSPLALAETVLGYMVKADISSSPDAREHDSVVVEHCI
jgi:hypothetical protein